MNLTQTFNLSVRHANGVTYATALRNAEALKLHEEAHRFDENPPAPPAPMTAQEVYDEACGHILESWAQEFGRRRTALGLALYDDADPQTKAQVEQILGLPSQVTPPSN